MKSKTIKSILLAALIGVCPLSAFAGGDSLDKIIERVNTAVENKVVQIATEMDLQSGSPFVSVRAKWEMTKLVTVRKRKVSVTVPWGKPWTVETVCEAMHQDGKLYVAKSCYYPATRNDQGRRWLSTSLIEANGHQVSLEEPETKTNDFVAFNVPDNVLPANLSQGRLSCAS